MSNMIGIYHSGTGNTRHCIEKLVHELDEDAKVYSIEEPALLSAIKKANTIVLGYPIHFSNAPLMIRDFIKKNAQIWKGKHMICVATMGLFSGDGAGCTARLLKRYGAIVEAGIHLRMPDSVCDSKALKKTINENHKIIIAADKKIEKKVEEIKRGKYPKEGLGFFYHMAGLFGQRLWFYGNTLHYSDKLKINTDKCVGCGNCAQVCPMKNISMVENKPVTNHKCTLCYRCISLCPKQAITLVGKDVVEQCRFEKYK